MQHQLRSTGPSRSPRPSHTPLSGVAARSRMRYTLAAACLLASVASRAASQAPSPAPRPGDRVRMWAADGPHIGVFDSLHAGLVVLRGHPPLSLTQSQHIDIAVGHRGHALEGAGLGFLVGGGVGVLLARGQSAGTGNMDYGAAAGALAIGLGVWAGSTILGGIVGSKMKGDRWRRVVPWPPSIEQSRPTPQSTGTPVAAVVRIPIRIPL
jgi:hypothetical protein